MQMYFGSFSFHLKFTNTWKQNSFQQTQIFFPKCIEHQIFLDVQLQPLPGLGITKLYNY